MDISGFVNDQNAFNEKITNDVGTNPKHLPQAFPSFKRRGKLTEVSSMTVSMISQIRTAKDHDIC